MAKKKQTGRDLLDQYKQATGYGISRQSSSGSTNGQALLDDYLRNGGGQNVKNGPYNPDYRTNTRKATPQSYEAAYQQYKQIANSINHDQLSGYLRTMQERQNQIIGSINHDQMSGYRRTLQEKERQQQRKVQTGTAAQQAATNAGQDYSRLIGLNQFDGELERRAAEQEKRYRETVLPDQLRGMKRTSAEMQKQLDQLYEQKSDEHFRDYQFDENGTAWYTDENGTRRQARGVMDIQSEIDTLETRKAALDSTRALGQAKNAVGTLDTETRNLLKDINGTNLLKKTDAKHQLQKKGYSEDQIGRLAEYEKYLEDFEDYQMRMSGAQQFGQDAPVFSTVTSSLMAPFKALGNIESLRGILPKGLGGYQNADMPTNIYSPMYAATHVSSGIRSGVMEGMGPVGQFLYQAGTSALDSAVNMAVSTALVGTTGLSGEAASSAVAETMNWVMGSQVAADSVYAGIQSGKSNQEALIDGIVEGAIEGFTEKYSVGDIIETMLSGKQVWKKALRAFASEGAEEIASNWLNRIYDVAAKHDRGEVMGAYAEYLSKGNTKEKALALTLADMLKEDGLSFLAGGISGLAMSGAYAGTNKVTEAYNKGEQLNVIGQVMDAVESMAKDRGDKATAEAAQAVMDKVKAGQMPETAEVQAVVDSAVKADQAAQEEAAFQTYNQYADERDAQQAAREAQQQTPMQAVQEAASPQQAPTQTVIQAVQETEERAQEPTLPEPWEAEQAATQETNEKGTVGFEEQQENVVSDGGSRRESGQRAGKPLGAVAGGTEKANAAAQQSRTAVERQNRARDLRLPKVSTVELGVSRGTGYRGNTVFMRENWDAGMKETASRVKQRTGLETTYVLGPLQVRTSNGGTARAAAVVTGERIIVQADNLRATIDQLADHETYHWIAGNTPGLNAKIEQNIRDTFSEEEFDQIVETYIRSRRGINDVPTEGTDAEFDEALNAIKEEIYADAYAGVNAFGAHADQYQQTVREAAEPRTTAQTAEKTGETRGPPEKYSINNTRHLSWNTQVDGYFSNDGSIRSSDSLYLGESNVEGVLDAPLYIPTSVINKAVRLPKGSRSAHALSKSDIMNLESGVYNAPAVIVNPARNAVVFVTENTDASGNYIIASFDLNNNLFGETAHKATSIHGQVNLSALFENLGADAMIFVKNENKLNQMLPGNQILKSLELLAKVELDDGSVTENSGDVNEKFSVTEATDEQEDRRRSERVNLPTIAKQELKSTLFKMFSVSKTQRTDVGRVIDYFADRIYTNGELTQTDRDVFLARLYSSGAMMESLRQQPDAVPDIVGDGRLYVSERARREFGSEWNDFRKRAFGAGIYLTDSSADRSAEAWTQALSEAAPDTFGGIGGNQRQRLEQIVQAAEEAQDQNLSLSEYAQALAGRDFISDDAILENMERQVDWAMRTFAEKAKLEVSLRDDKTAAIEAERDRLAQRSARRSQNNEGVIEAMEAHTDERIQKKDAAAAKSKEKLIDAMEARIDERLQKKDAALAKSKEKLIDAMEARIDERLQREKAREANRRALERQDRKDMAARQKARRELQELQKKTLKTLQWLNKNRFRAPEELREQFDEVLSDIDLYAVGTANEMQWSGKYNATWRDLAQMYQDAKANDPNFLPSKELERIVTRLDARKIGDMDLDALGKLYQAAVDLRTEFMNRNRVLGDAEERIFEDVYADSVREINSAAGGYTGKLTDRFMNMEQLSTMNMLERMAGWNPNSTWYGMAKQLEKGERDAQSYQVTAAQILKDFMQKNREWVMRSDGQGKDAIWYEIKVPELLELGMGDKPIFGKTVTVYMTPAQKVHMYLESRNYDNLRHMAGGRTFANRELYSKGKRQEAFAQGTTIKLAPETVKAIVSDLTVEEKALADVLDRYYNGYAKGEINRVSNILYGYDKAMGKNYAPIFTNSSFTKSEPGIYDATAEGVGNLKTRQVSKNPTYNIGAYDAFERNVSQTSRFVGMAIPARNWKTLLNWRGSTTSMKTVIDGKWGEVTEKYITDQLTKLEAGGSSEQDFVTTAADKIFSNYIAATFGFNPSIVLKQAGSIPLAAAYLGAENTPSPKQIAQIDRTLISKYTKMLDYRLMGYATPETKQLKDHPTKLQNNKVLNFAFGGGAITAMDGWAASTLWPWAENAVRRENPELEIGTQEQIDAGQSPFYQKVAERFNDAVARSQSTSDEMHQGRLRKSKNALAKAVTMFRSDSAQVYNTVRQAIGEAQYYKRSGASIEVQRRANRRVGQAFVSAAGGYIWSTAVTFLMALLKHKDKKYRDDDGNLTALSVLKGMGEDLLSSIAGAASMGGEEVLELIGGTLSGERFYDIFNSQSAEQLNKVLELIDTHGKNINKFVTDGADLIKNKGDLTLYLKRYGNDMLGDIRNLAKEIATYGFSLPANNLETYILGTVKTVSPTLGTAYDDAMQTANRNLLKGLTGDALQTRVQHVFQVRDVDVTREAAQAVARLYEAGYTNAAPADTPTSLTIHDENRELKAYQKQTYDVVWSEAVRNNLNELVQSDAFQSAGDDQQAKMLAKLYDYAAEQAKSVLFDDYEADAYVEKFKELAGNGVPESASIAYSVMAANVEGEKDADGKTISGSKRDEAMGILDGMELTGSQKSALLAANYSTTGFEPWSGYREALKAGGDTWDAFYQNTVNAKVADGKTQEAAEKAVKSALKSQLKEDYLGGSMPEGEVSDYLQKYCGAEDEHDVYWTLEEWKGGEGWKKYGQFLDAVDKGVLADTKKVAKEYMKHGVDKGDLSSQLTTHFKEAWLAATGDEATRLKNAYISAYKAIGGDADKARDNIIKWRQEANKKKGEKK